MNHFNPLPPHGGRPPVRLLIRQGRYFNPLPPHGGRQRRRQIWTDGRDFNPLPPHGGRRNPARTWTLVTDISIHSLRMEGDMTRTLRTSLEKDISIHSLRMEGDNVLTSSQLQFKIFQSTPSAWRETSYIWNITGDMKFQSTPSAWRETQHSQRHTSHHIISIHSLRMEGDTSVRRQ